MNQRFPNREIVSFRSCVRSCVCSRDGVVSSNAGWKRLARSSRSASACACAVRRAPCAVHVRPPRSNEKLVSFRSMLLVMLLYAQPFKCILLHDHLCSKTGTIMLQYAGMVTEGIPFEENRDHQLHEEKGTITYLYQHRHPKYHHHLQDRKEYSIPS